jgi:hypothetical protein
MILAAAVGLVLGCGGSNSPPPAEPKTPLADPPAPQPQPGPTPPPGGDPGKAARPATTGWEMDPAKHVPPTSPVAGKIGGEPVTAEVALFDHTLTFRLLKPDAPQRAIGVVLAPEQLKDPAGVRLVVRPDQKDGPDVPRVTVETPPPPGTTTPAITAFSNGYALTLEMKKEKNRYTGTVCLALPDDAKSYMTGTFAVTRVRGGDTPPGPDDLPLVQGKVTVTGADAPVVVAGYVGAGVGADGQPVQGQIDQMFATKGLYSYAEFADGRVSGFATPTDAAPHGRYEHTRLAPLRYLVYARVNGGPAAWKWLAVGSESQVAADFALDAGKTGAVEVQVPAGADEVRLAPADDAGKPLEPGLFLAASFVLDLAAKTKDGKAAFAKLGPGRYEVRAGDLSDVVEVKPGETAKIELKKK